MNLKTSFFNKSIIKSDLKRFWWVGALNALCILIFFTAIYIDYVFERFPILSDERFLNMGGAVTAFACIFPVMLAAIIFSYINSSQAVACLHGLPVKRKTFFASHILSGGIILIFPIVLNVIIFLLFRLDPDIATSFNAKNLFLWAASYTIYNLMIFAFSSMVMMILANTVAGIVFSYIFAVLPVMAEVCIKAFLEQHLFGYSASSENVISNFLYSFPDAMYEAPLGMIKYIIFAILFFIFAYFIYKKRKLEYNAEIVAFPKLRAIFVYGVGICAGAAGYAYLSSLFSLNNILFLIPFGILGIIIAQMIAQKTLKPRKIFKSLIIFSLSICVLQFAFQIDLSGYERRVPSLEKIESVSFTNGVNERTYSGYTKNGDKIIYPEDEDVTDLTSSLDIENVILLHKELIENRDFSPLNPVRINISYKLKNGRTLSRYYLADYNFHKKLLKPIIESEEIRKIYFPILMEKAQKDYISVNVYDTRTNSEKFKYDANSPEALKILEALKKDTMTTAYESFADSKNQFTRIRLSYTQEGKYENGETVEYELLPTNIETYYVRSDYKETIKLLDELGFYNSLPTAKDIEMIGFNYFNNLGYAKPESSSVITYEFSDRYWEFSKATQDPKEIAEIYEYINSRQFSFLFPINEHSISVEIVLKNGHTFNFHIDSNAEDLPDVLKKYCP